MSDFPDRLRAESNRLGDRPDADTTMVAQQLLDEAAEYLDKLEAVVGGTLTGDTANDLRMVYAYELGLKDGTPDA